MVIGVYDIRLRNSNSGKQDRNGYNGHEILHVGISNYAEIPHASLWNSSSMKQRDLGSLVSQDANNSSITRPRPKAGGRVCLFSFSSCPFCTVNADWFAAW